MIPFLYTFYRFGRGIKVSLKDPEFEALLTLVLITLGTGTYFYHLEEGWGWIDSLYFSVTTLTTVGFGDLAPHSAASKLFTIVYLIVGVGVLLSFINYVAMKTIEEQKNSSIIPVNFISWGRKKDSSSS